MRRLSRHALSFALGAGAMGAATALADDAPAVVERMALVTPGEGLVPRVAPSGKATIVELARGEQAFVGRLTMAPGAAVPEHRDETEEYIHVVSGGGTITLDGDEVAISAGDTVYMPANARVSYVNGAEELVAIQVFAGPGPADKYDAWKPAP